MSLYRELADVGYKGYAFTKYAQDKINEAERRASKEGKITTGYRRLNYHVNMKGGGRAMSIDVPIFGRDPRAAEEDLRKEQARLAGIQQATYEKQQADLASQLKIIQGQKSEVAKMRDEYSQMLIAEAERRKKAEEDARIALQAQRSNRMMESQAANLQIQPAGTTPRTGGTQQFRRRAIQQGTTTPYTGLSKIQSGTVNV